MLKRTLILLILLSASQLFSQDQLRNIFPFDGEVRLDSTVQFKWSSNFYASQSYQLQIATDVNFASVVLDSLSISSNGLLYHLPSYTQDYFWRVRWNNGVSFSSWSTTSYFKIFDPISIGGLTVWIDPNRDVLLNGAAIQQIDDQSGMLNTASQLLVASQPLLVTNDSTINYKSLMKYDGANDFMEIADNNSIDYVSEFSIFLLYKPTVIATNKTFLAKWDYPTQGSWAWQTGYSASDEMLYSPAASITDAAPASVQTTNTDFLLEPTFLGLVFNGAESTNKIKFYKNSNLLNAGITAGFGATLPNSTASLKIGKYGGAATRYMNGNIGEFLIYNNVLTASQKLDVESYMRYKYSPPVSIGNDTILQGNNLCGSFILGPQKPFLSYLWSTGQTTKTITVTAAGEYWLETTDFFGFISRDTLKIYPPFDFNTPASNTTICLGSNVTWATGYPSSNFTFQWQDNSVNSSIAITAPGNYFVTISDLFGCSINSDTINILVDTYAQTAFLGADTSLCADNLIALQVGAPETVSYIWPNASTGLNYVVDTTGNYFVETTNINGCIARDTIHVIVTGQAPIADFSFQNQCFGLPNSFADLSVGLPTDAVVLWNWDFGDGNLNNSQNPNHTYGTDSSFTVQLYVESAGGCGAFHTETVTVHAVPTAAFTKVGHCSGQSVQFTNSSVLGDAPISTYLWNFDQPWTGTANTSVVPTPFRNFDIAGTYNISLQITDTNGCIDGVIIPLAINQAPTVAFTAADACASAPISFTNTSVVEAPATYLWDFGDLTSSILPLPVKFFSNIGVHTITLTATAGNGCVNTLQQQMNVNPNPVATMNVGPMCMVTYTSLTDNSTIVSGSIVSSLWILNTTDSLAGPTNNFIFNSLGQQQVVLQVTSDMGCTAMANQFIDIVEELDASFTASTSIIAAGEPITFTSTTPTLSIVSWDFGDGNSLNFVSPTTYQYGSNYVDSTVIVSMFVSNVLGCMDTATMQISIQPMRLDLSLSNLYVQDINGFYTIGIELKNEGSITITHADLKVLLPDGPVASEVWNGNLIPGSSEIYIFNSTIDAYIPGANGSEAFLCATGVGFDLNNNAEVFLDNNKVCKNLVGEAVVLLPIYPNPASNNVTIELLVTLDADVSIELVDARGRLIKTILPTQSLAAGLYTYDVDISQIQAGTYFVRMRNGDVDAMNKLLITN